MKVRQLFEVESAYQRLVLRLRADYRQSFKALFETKLPLWRGDQRPAIKDKGGDIGWLENKKRVHPRKSLTGNNFVLHWIANSEKWEDVPSRLWSISCALNSSDAAEFGQPMLVVPADSVTSFASTPEDFNFNVTETGHTIMDVGGSLGELMQIMHSLQVDVEHGRESVSPTLRKILNYKGVNTDFQDQLTERDFHNISRIIDALVDFDERYGLKDEDSTLNSVVQQVRDMIGENSLDYWVDNNLTPEKLGVKSFDSVGDMAEADLPPKSEVWFVGPYILLSVIDLHEMQDPYKHPALVQLRKDVLG